MTLQTIERGLDDETLADLRAVPVERGRPLVAVDCDEVMVAFAGHVTRWLPSTGHEMRLTEYRLEGSMFPIGEATPVPFDACIALLDRFFHEETTMQQAIPGAAEALARLARDIQVVILTNAPRFARTDRAVNVRALGMDYPLVVNTGGKGRALEWLRRKAGAPVAFIDDSPQQLAHAARHAPDVTRIHFVGAPHLTEILRESPEAHSRAHDWAEAEEQVRAALL
jgi:hypothetical protein